MHYVTGTAAELGPRLIDALGRYRHRVFVQHLGWKLPDANTDHEWDSFDRPDTVHVLALTNPNLVVGCARLLPTRRPYLLAEVFAQLLDGAPAPHSADLWELSRFAAVDFSAASTKTQTLGSTQSLELLRAAMREASSRGARSLISVSPIAIQRILRSASFPFSRLGAPHDIGGQSLFACSMPLQPVLQPKPEPARTRCALVPAT